MEKTGTSPLNNIDEFDTHVNLYRLISGGKGNGLVMLRRIVDKIHYDNYACPDSKLPSILIVGKEGTRTHALALLNSLAVEDVRECHAKYLDNGISSQILFEDSTRNVAHLITNIDSMRNDCVLWRYLRLGRCEYYNPFGGKIVVHYNGLVVLTASDAKKVSTPILNAVDFKVELEGYTQEQLELVVLQRIKLLGLEYESEDVLKCIVEFGNGEIKRIIDFLRLCVVLLANEQQAIITSGIINRAARLP